MAAKVSVITPSYNQGKFLERTLDSVLQQKFRGELEYFVMDGGSTDESVDILKRYDSSLVWSSEKDRGQAHAVNKGLARASGEIIGWLNSDDIYYPGAIAAALEIFDSHPEVDLVYGDAYHIDEQDRIIEPYPTEPWNFERLLFTCFLCQPAVFFRSSVVERLGPLNEKLQYCLDYEYWIRLSRGGVKTFWLKQVLAGSRLYATNKTLGARVRVHREINFMFRKQLNRVPDRWLFNYAHTVLDERGISRGSKNFPLLVSVLSVYSALRWNYRISISMGQTILGWLKDAAKRYREAEIAT